MKLSRGSLAGILKVRGPLVGILFILLGISVITVSAFVYQQANQTVDQNIVEVATITLKNFDLGDLDEGETKTYTKSEVANLGDAITVITTKGHVYLHLDSDLDSLTDYSTYNILVRFSAVVGKTYNIGDVACTLSLVKPFYSSIDLDVPGIWKFDYEITTTANSVNEDVSTQVTINVSAESTA